MLTTSQRSTYGPVRHLLVNRFIIIIITVASTEGLTLIITRLLLIHNHLSQKSMYFLYFLSFYRGIVRVMHSDIFVKWLTTVAYQTSVRYATESCSHSQWFSIEWKQGGGTAIYPVLRSSSSVKVVKLKK